MTVKHMSFHKSEIPEVLFDHLRDCIGLHLDHLEEKDDFYILVFSDLNLEGSLYG